MVFFIPGVSLSRYLAIKLLDDPDFVHDLGTFEKVHVDSMMRGQRTDGHLNSQRWN